MTFLEPVLLWSFAALLPLAALFFLKVRPRRKPTTAFFLWEQVFRERRANSLFKRLRDFWSLLLLATACSAVCLALGRPVWSDRREDLLILIDNSASMAARDGGTTRIELAKRAAAGMIEGLNGTQRAAVATAADRIGYRSHLTDNPRELLDAVNSVAASNQSLRLEVLPGRDDLPPAGDTSGENNPSEEGADAAGRLPRDHRVLLVSDGCFDVGLLPRHIELIAVGTPLENMGIVAADMAYLSSGTNRLAFYCQVASSFAEPQQVDLTVARVDDRGAEQLAKVIPLEVRPGRNRAETFTLENAQPGKWIARLGVHDALSEDDTARLVATLPEPIRVGVRSEDRYFLEKSVLAFSRSAGLLTLAQEQAEVVLATAASPDGERLLLFQPQGNSPWWKDLGDGVQVTEPRVMLKDHPALRHVDAATIPFVGSRRLTPPPGAQVLVADEHGSPLIYAAKAGRRKAVVVNMDPVAAQFYFSAWFPVLVHSASAYLAGREDPLLATYRPGDRVSLPGASDDTVSACSAPAGETTKVRGKWLTLDDRLGYFELSNPAGHWSLGTSLMAEAETMLDNSKATDTSLPLNRGRSPAHWLTVLAICLVAFESVLYHRRKVG